MLQPLIRHSRELSPLGMIGQEVRMLVGAADTGGSHSIFEIVVPVGDGPPPHVHSREDETFIVLEGEIEMLVEDPTGAPAGSRSSAPLRSHRLTAGSCAFGPRGVAHTFRNLGPDPARVLVICTPGGFERFGQDVAAAFPAGAAMDPVRLTRIMEAHGMKVAH
jgi:mannose-6-phosphate isomerase-like protein (cupin superfamily)